MLVHLLLSASVIQGLQGFLVTLSKQSFPWYFKIKHNTCLNFLIQNLVLYLRYGAHLIGLSSLTYIVYVIRVTRNIIHCYTASLLLFFQFFIDNSLPVLSCSFTFKFHALEEVNYICHGSVAYFTKHNYLQFYQFSCNRIISFSFTDD